MGNAAVDRTLAALADPTRRAVIEMLKKRPLRSSEIAAALAMTRPAMSRHLRILRRAGLVDEEGLEDDARARVYQLRQERFRELSRWIEEVQAFWGGQLAAFKAHAEQASKRKARA